MITFREKSFGGAWTAYKKNAPAIISTAALGISATNLATNRHRVKQADEYNKQQLSAMSNLTKELKNTAQSMKDVNSSLREKGIIVQTVEQPKPKRKKLFKW